MCFVLWVGNENWAGLSRRDEAVNTVAEALRMEDLKMGDWVIRGVLFSGLLTMYILTSKSFFSSEVRVHDMRRAVKVSRSTFRTSHIYTDKSNLSFPSHYLHISLPLLPLTKTLRKLHQALLRNLLNIQPKPNSIFPCPNLLSPSLPRLLITSHQFTSSPQ